MNNINKDIFFNINSFEEFKNNKKIKNENYDEILKFYKLRYSDKNPPFYHCIPLYNTILNNNNFQYMVISYEDGDSVFVAYKIIQIIKTKQIRIIDTPISLHNNKLHEEEIIIKLKQLPFVKLVYKENILYNSLNKDRLLVEYNDYFYNFKLHNFNGRFKSKNGINKMLKNKNFEIKIKHNLKYEYIRILIEKWIDGMNKNNSKVSNSFIKDFKKIVTYYDENLYSIIIEYKNKPISIQTILINKKLNFANCLYINHLGREKTEDESLNIILKNMCDIQNYLAYMFLKEKNIYYMYIAGCRPNEKRLLKHKERISDGCIKYFIDDNKGDNNGMEL